MFCLLGRGLLLSQMTFSCTNLITKTSHLRFFLLLQPQPQLIRSISTTPTQASSNQSSSFTVSYLVNSCGLSPESALSASKKIHFTSPTKPDLVLHFLRNQGFSDTQIANLITKRPLLLLANPEKTLLPKLKFLNQIGVSDPEIAHFLSKEPTFLVRSLERQIKPSYDYLKSLLGTDEKATAAIKTSCCSWILQINLQRLLGHKVEILRKYGMPERNIEKLVMVRMRTLIKNNDRFDELVRNVSEMGIDPSSAQFANALHVFSGMNESTLESKLEMFRSYGWSDDEIVLAIRNQPICISISKEKLNGGLDFFMNKLKWKPLELARHSNLLGLSLQKRIIPRWMVIQFLLSKCLISDGINIASVLKLAEAKFIEKFLVKYESEFPEILKLYQGKL
ncbi:hypothetical protein Syun_014454 [Stephania yunnanensis]|uniref:Uncharacterized protein n=1 Tax=Stephania yunnanensis TaxID=152371 RepID=A0AAP0JJS7_9MAGN